MLEKILITFVHHNFYKSKSKARENISIIISELFKEMKIVKVILNHLNNNE
jgi:hypothetical protein